MIWSNSEFVFVLTAVDRIDLYFLFQHHLFRQAFHIGYSGFPGNKALQNPGALLYFQ